MLCIKSGLPVDPLERTCRVDIFVRPPMAKIAFVSSRFHKRIQSVNHCYWDHDV